MIIKTESITLIGKIENIEEIINKIQETDKNKNEWFVISSQESKKIPNYYVVKIIKKGEINNVNKQ